MRLASFEQIVRALDQESVRYIIAGGLAFNAHGHLRFTKDVDVVLALESENVLRAFAALQELGYRPNVPVTAEQFADARTREGWVRDEGMQVLQLWSDAHPETPLDLFAREPFDFDEEYARALVKPLHGTIAVPFVSLRTPIGMKEAVGREQDRVDVEHLRLRLEEDHDDGAR